jgi:hypothetical protein
MASDVGPVADPFMPGLSELLDDIDQAVIVHDASGRIQLLNRAARRLFPDLDLGDQFGRDAWGCGELAGSGESFVTEAGGRRVSGRLRRLATGWQAWVVSDIGPDTEGRGTGNPEARCRDATGGPVDQQGFMLQASRELAAGVSHEAAVAALVRLAVPAVGEQAAVLLPLPRARVSWWRCAEGAAAPVRGVARAPALRTAPVLASALRGTTADTTTVPPDELAELAAVLGRDVAERVPVIAAPLRDRIGPRGCFSWSGLSRPRCLPSWRGWPGRRSAPAAGGASRPERSTSCRPPVATTAGRTARAARGAARRGLPGSR